MVTTCSSLPPAALVALVREGTSPITREPTARILVEFADFAGEDSAFAAGVENAAFAEAVVAGSATAPPTAAGASFWLLMWTITTATRERRSSQPVSQPTKAEYPGEHIQWPLINFICLLKKKAIAKDANKTTILALLLATNKTAASTTPHTAPKIYNTQSGVAPREAPFRSIDAGEVALRSLPT